MALSEKNLSKLGTLEKAKKYQGVQHRLYFISLILTGLILAVLAFSPAGSWVRKLTDPFQNHFLQIQIYFVIFSLIFFVIDLPLSFYSGYVVEKRFELSNHTVRSWCWDAVKKGILSFAIASLLIQVFYWFIRIQPENWWWMTWIFYFLFSLFFTKIMPLWIIPLFYKYGPIESESLKTRIWKLGEQNGLRIKNFFSLNLSRTTKKANAMFTGLGKSKRVVLADTLLRNFNEDEIEVVLAHEIGHFKYRHIRKNILLSAGFSLVLFYVCFLFLRTKSAAAGLPAADPLFFASLAFLLWIISTLSGPLFKAISRFYERQADAFALKETRNREAFISTFEKLASQNLADPDPSPWIERLLYSHPSIKKRIEFAKEYEI